MPAVSVILPTRDRGALLARALRSLAAQDFRDFEVVLVDDNRVEPRIAAQAALAPLLVGLGARVIETGGARNAAAARNAGLAAARGEWITYLDDDDAYAPTKLGAQVALARRGAAALVLCGFAVRLPGRVRVKQTACERFCGDAVLLEATFGTPFLMHRAGPELRFSEEFDAGEDLVFAHRLMAKAGVAEVPNVPEPLVDVWPQAGARVNTRGRAICAAMDAVARERGADFSVKALGRWRARRDLVAFKLGEAGWSSGALAATRLLVRGGFDETRFAANALASRLPVLGRRVVS